MKNPDSIEEYILLKSKKLIKRKNKRFKEKIVKENEIENENKKITRKNNWITGKWSNE